MKTVSILQSKELINPHDDEYYNLIRTNIQLSSADLKTIMITSFNKGEGKSSVSFNLALSFAKLGKRVLLVDADVRNSAIYSRLRFGAGAQGLTGYLAGQAHSDDIIYKTEYENFMIIPSGPIPPNPSALLQEKRFDILLKAMREYCDYIFIDSPPLGLVADALLLASKSDGNVLVAEDGYTKKKDVKKMVADLKETGGKFLGIILNKVSFKDKSYGVYGNYGNYGNYGKKSQS